MLGEVILHAGVGLVQATSQFCHVKTGQFQVCFDLFDIAYTHGYTAAFDCLIGSVCLSYLSFVTGMTDHAHNRYHHSPAALPGSYISPSFCASMLESRRTRLYTHAGGVGTARQPPKRKTLETKMKL